MSKQWTIENDTGAELTVRAPNGFAVELDANSADPRERFAYFAIRQQARDIAELRAQLAESSAATADQRASMTQHADELYAAVTDLCDERDKLRTDLAAAVSENAALLAANRDLKAHFDALKGDYDEAAHFARHFIRDDAAITPRGAIIRLGDKCTDLFVRLQQAESRLAAIDAAPTYMTRGDGLELIARPAKDVQT